MTTSLGLNRFDQIGRTIYAFPSLDSTNAQALKLLSNGRPVNGTIVTADYQTAGRGQAGHTWHSAPGLNLCLSVITYPNIRPGDQFLLNMVCALAVRDVVQPHAPESAVRVKWPNDVYIGNDKIAGILIQTGIQGSALTSAVLGIGLNVNQVNFPDELTNPTSIRRVTGTGRIDLANTRQQLCAALELRFGMLNEQGKLRQAYHDALYQLNETAQYRHMASGQLDFGRIVEVDQSGRLVVRWEHGKTDAFRFREIEFILPG